MFLSVLLLFLLPFVTNGEGMDPLFPQRMLVQLLVSGILVAWSLGVLVKGRLVWIQTPALMPLAGLLAWILLGWVLSPYPVLAGRALSLWVCFPLWYLLLTLTCFESWKAENLLIVFLAGGLGTSLWAIGQVLGLFGGAWLEIVKNQFGGKVTAGMGEPDLLAAYLLTVWPLGLALYLRSKQFLTRMVWSGLTLLGLLALLATGSRAGLLGWGVGTLVFALCFFGRGKFQSKAGKVALVAAATVLLLVLSAPFFPRLRDGLGARNASLRERALLWRGAAEMVKARPLQGTGLGTFEAAFPPYRPAGLMMKTSGLGYQVRHARNGFLEWTAETGIVGLLLLALFGWMVLRQWWRLFAANAIPRALGAGVFGSVAAIGVENLFESNLYSPAVLVPLVLFAMLPVPLSQRFFHLEGFPIRRREIDLSRFRIVLLMLSVSAAFLAFQVAEGAFKGQMAEILLKRGADSQAAGKWEEALGFFDKALGYDPADPRALYLRGTTYGDRAQEGDRAKALADLDALSALSPDYRLIHLKKYEILTASNHPVEAAAELKRAIRLDPMLIYLSPEFRRARDLTAQRHFSEAFIVYQNLFFDYPTCVPLMIDYANCFALTHDYVSAINLYRRVLELDPGNTKAANDLRKVTEVAQKAPKSSRKPMGMGL
jgi:O-antigen ligase